MQTGIDQAEVMPATEPRIGKHQFGIYAQDSWKITRKLTFDYGVRYDYSTYLREQYGRNPIFGPTVPNPAARATWLRSLCLCIVRVTPS